MRGESRPPAEAAPPRSRRWRERLGRLTEPPPSLTDSTDRLRSKLLSGYVIVLALVFACVDTSLSLSLPGYEPPWFGWAALLTIFAFNRAGYYRIAALMIVGMFPLVIFGFVYVFGNPPALSFGYLPLGPMIAAIFLPAWGVAVYTALNLCGVALGPLIIPERFVDSSQWIGPLSANAMVGILAILYIVHRNAIERERGRVLADSEQRLRLSLDAAQMGTWQIDAAHRRLSLDARASAMLGPLEKPDALVAAFAHDDAEVLSEAIATTAAGGRAGFSLVVRVREPARGHFEISGRGVCDAEGRVLRVIGTLVDVSDRQNLEAQLRQAQKMEALGRMSGGIAHDFNNVLTVIQASVVLLRRRGVAGELEHIESATRSAASLTSKLLAFSRGAVVAPRVLDLDEVVSGATAMIARLIGEDVEIRHRAAASRWLTRVDSSQLEQVLFNLATNARDAMPQGGTLGIEVDNMVVGEEITSHHPNAEPGPYVRLRVSDSGKGMDAETLRHIFEPFFTTKDRGKGTGLGLAMVFGVVSQSGGFIETWSAPGGGTRFDLYFPRAYGEAPAAQSSKLPTARGHETLLLVEDDDAVRTLIRMLLEEAGYTVITAASASEARQQFAAHSREVSLVITDEVMPGGRGSDLVRELRRIRPELRALGMTGYLEPRASPAGMVDVLPTLQKPFDAEVLVRRVRELLDAPLAAPVLIRQLAAPN